MVIYALIFIVCFAIAALLTPIAQWLSKKWGIVAVPGGRRTHQGHIPKLGGIPIYGAFLVGVVLVYIYLPPLPNSTDAQLLRGLIVGSVIVFLGGLVDDRLDTPPWFQFAIQFAATAAVVIFELFLEVFTNPLTGQEVHIWPVLVPIITLFWISGMMNTVNWLDGLDGLAAGVGTIAALLFAWHSYNLGQITIAAFPLALAGGLIGFLLFNYTPARIFLGSAGAYFLGYGLATLAILAPAKIATALLVMAVPIIDVAWQIFDRLRRGQSPLRGDRGHLHFRLSDGGLPTQRIVLGYYAISTAFGLIAIFAPGMIKLIMLIILSIVVLVLMGWLSNRRNS